MVKKLIKRTKRRRNRPPQPMPTQITIRKRTRLLMTREKTKMERTTVLRHLLL